MAATSANPNAIGASGPAASTMIPDLAQFNSDSVSQLAVKQASCPDSSTTRDETLMDALRSSRDRLFLLKQEADMFEFVSDTTKSQLQLPLMNSYQRLLVHRCADHFRLQRDVDSDTKAVTLSKTPATRLPSKKLVQIFNQANAQLKPTDISPFAVLSHHSAPAPTLKTSASDSQDRLNAPADPSSSVQTNNVKSGFPEGSDPQLPGTSTMPPAGFRIMRRDPSLGNTRQARPTSAQSSTSSLAVDAAKKNRKDMTIEEREAAYREARERIFGTSAATEPMTATKTMTGSAADENKSNAFSGLDGGLQKPGALTTSDLASGNTAEAQYGKAQRADGPRELSPNPGVQSTTLNTATSGGHAGGARSDAWHNQQEVAFSQPLSSKHSDGRSADHGLMFWPTTALLPQQIQPPSQQQMQHMAQSRQTQWPTTAIPYQHGYGELSSGYWQQYPQYQQQAPQPGQSNFGPYHSVQQQQLPAWQSVGATNLSPSLSLRNAPQGHLSSFNIDAFSPFPPTPSNLSSSGTGSVGMPSPAPSVISSSSSRATRDRDGDEKKRHIAWQARSNDMLLPEQSLQQQQQQQQQQQLRPPSMMQASSVQNLNSANTLSPSPSAYNDRPDVGLTSQALARRNKLGTGGNGGRLNVGERTLFDPNLPTSSPTSSSASQSSGQQDQRGSSRNMRNGLQGNSLSHATQSTANDPEQIPHGATTAASMSTMAPISSHGASHLWQNQNTALMTGQAPYQVAYQHPALQPVASHRQYPSMPIHLNTPGQGKPVVLGNAIRLGAIVPASTEGGSSPAPSTGVPGVSSANRNHATVFPDPASKAASHPTGTRASASANQRPNPAGLPPRPDWVLRSHGTVAEPGSLAYSEAIQGHTPQPVEHCRTAPAGSPLLTSQGLTGVDTPRTKHSQYQGLSLTSCLEAAAAQRPSSPSPPRLESPSDHVPALRRRYSHDSISISGTSDHGSSSLRGTGSHLRRHHLRRRFSSESAGALSDDGSYSSLGPSASASNVGDFQDEEDDEEEDDEADDGNAEDRGVAKGLRNATAAMAAVALGGGGGSNTAGRASASAPTGTDTVDKTIEIVA